MEQSSPPTTPTFGVLDGVQGAVEVCSVPAGDRGVDGWMTLISEVSAAMTVLAAGRDAAVVRLAAIDEVVTEDGVIGEQVNGLGTICIDAGAMVSTATGTSARFGQEMVTQAVTRVVRVPELHDAMLAGVLDDYKARCIAGELTDVPIELARTVVDALRDQMADKTGPALRRRTRDILFKLAPELLKERLRAARNAVGVRRWEGEPGTDNWSAVFPSERAAQAWAAITELGRRYVQDGDYPTLEMARAYALLDLVDGNATVETVLHLTVPAATLAEAERAEREHAEQDQAEQDQAEQDQAEQDQAEQKHADSAAPEAANTRPRRPSAESLSGASSPRPPVRRKEADASNGSDEETVANNRADGENHSFSTARQHAPRSAATSGGARRDPGADSAAHESTPQSSGHTAPTSGDTAPTEGSPRNTDETTSADGSVTFVAVADGRGRGTRWVPLDSLRTQVAPRQPRMPGGSRSWARPRRGDPGPAARFCHPDSGALVDADHDLSTERYRPSDALKAFIRQRDGRCRFPGCVITARFCDIDHVIPWPLGSTAADGLMCLCRRHHRIKQRHRWRVRLLANGTAEWTDPTGRVLTTDPVDHLRSGQVRVSELRSRTADQVRELLEDEQLRALAEAHAAHRRTAPEREAAAARNAEAARRATAEYRRVLGADALAESIVKRHRAGTSSERALTELLAEDIRSSARRMHREKRYPAGSIEQLRATFREEAAARTEASDGRSRGRIGLCDLQTDVVQPPRRPVLRYRPPRRHREYAKLAAASGPPY